MAEVFKRVNGKPIQKAMAQHDGVQNWLDEFIFEAGVRAEEDLLEHHFEGHAFIDIEQGNVDRYLILNDERGQKAAMSIEFGRQAGEKEVMDPATGEKTTISWGAMEGLYILHRAMKLKGKGPRVKLSRKDLRL